MKTFTDGVMGDWYRYLMYEFDMEREEEIAEEAGTQMSQSRQDRYHNFRNVVDHAMPEYCGRCCANIEPPV